jgi:hypothetical protein
VLDKLYAHVADDLRYSQPAPYNQQLIDILRLQPAAYLPGGSLASVCEHFRQHYAVTDRDDPLDDEKLGPKYTWCLVITDDALQSIENAPDPIGPTPPEGVNASELVYQHMKNMFVVLLNKNHTTMEKPEILASTGRGRNGHTIDWYGWCKVAVEDMMRIWTETDSGGDCIMSAFKHNDIVVDL